MNRTGIKVAPTPPPILRVNKKSHNSNVGRAEGTVNDVLQLSPQGGATLAGNPFLGPGPAALLVGGLNLVRSCLRKARLEAQGSCRVWSVGLSHGAQCWGARGRRGVTLQSQSLGPRLTTQAGRLGRAFVEGVRKHP